MKRLLATIKANPLAALTFAMGVITIALNVNLGVVNFASGVGLAGILVGGIFLYKAFKETKEKS